MKRLTCGLLAVALALTLTHVAQGEPARWRHIHRAQGIAAIDRESFAVANSDVIRVRHDRAWWVARFPHTRFVRFGGGYYYWGNGYWYPAYGYDPSYSTYIYDGPIYGSNNDAPGQVIDSVQVALRAQGYYHGAVDGVFGPQTRAALAQYQRSHGLIVTAAIDQPTLVTLGLA